MEAGIFHTTKWSKVPLGASGSSTIKTSVFASFGTPSNVKGGLISSPSHVYFDGIFVFFSKAELLISKFFNT
jgi:hypothetical protein